jgi:hypothetical protein
LGGESILAARAVRTDSDGIEVRCIEHAPSPRSCS